MRAVDDSFRSVRPAYRIMEENSVSYEEALRLTESHPADPRAFALLLAAEGRGDPRAKYALATWYLHGTDLVSRDIPKGIQLLKSIKNSNIAEALFDLAVAYDLGKGCKKNSRLAFELYFESALLGDPDACFQISEYFRAGEHVPHNKRIASLWLNRSRKPAAEISPSFRLSL